MAKPMTSEQQNVPAHGAMHRIVMPLVFVTLYGSGFVGAKLGLPYAEPLTFLAWRFALTCALLTLLSLWLKAPWPRSLREIGHMMVAGVLLVGVFSGGVFVAINLGVSPAVSALIIALQPILVALGAGPILGERVLARQWLGLSMGLVGVGFVVFQKLSFSQTHMLGFIMALVGLSGLTAGNLYQKRFCSTMNIFTGGVVQSAAAGVACLVGALAFESMTVLWSGQFVFALVWMAVVVSIGALSLLYVLIRHGEMSQVASLFYLVPVSAAVLSYLIYHETISAMGMLGIALTGLGIMLVSKKNSPGQA